jgi:putative DNA primase/helicase
MIAPVRDVRTGKLVGIHRTALADDGTGKREMPPGLPSKMIMGRAKGGAVMLQPLSPRLGIAEGIETALSAQRIFEMPVWATLSAAGVQNFPLIPGLKLLTIFADHDEPGLDAAIKCAKRYSRAGIQVDVRYPTVSGQDWNDLLKDESCQ